MRLTELFPDPGRVAPLLRAASATDDFDGFAAACARAPLREGLARSIGEAARAFAERAGIDPGEAGGGVFGGQQPYVDYYPAVLAKLDAVEACGGFWAFADFAAVRSDPWMARTWIPSAGAAEGVVRLGFYSTRAHAGKDLRFVPPPDDAALRHVEASLRQTMRGAGWPGSRARVSALMEDYRQARRRALNAAEFNSIWSARVFRRLGYRVPFVSESEWLARDDVLPSIAETLGLFIEGNDAVIDAVSEAMRFPGVSFTAKPRGHVPIAVAAPGTGIRQRARFERRGGEAVLVAGDETFRGDLAAILRSLRGRWSLDVFSPIFLFRLGVTGIVTGRGSMRYTLVLGRVMEALTGRALPPNLLCGCRSEPSGPLVEAVRRARGGLPGALADYEPTLVARLLTTDERAIREEIAASWRDGVVA